MERFLSPRELFSAEERRVYSYSAQRLYAGIWNQMNRLQSNEVTIRNGELIVNAKIPAEKFEGVQRQLLRAGLVQIEFDRRPNFVVEARRTVYRLPAQQETSPS